MNSSLLISKNLAILTLGIGLSSAGLAQTKPAMVVTPTKHLLQLLGLMRSIS